MSLCLIYHHSRSGEGGKGGMEGQEGEMGLVWRMEEDTHE